MMGSKKKDFSAWLPTNTAVARASVALISPKTSDEDAKKAAETILENAEKISGWKDRTLPEIGMAADAMAKRHSAEVPFGSHRALIRLSRLFSLQELLGNRQSKGNKGEQRQAEIPQPGRRGQRGDPLEM